MPKYEVIMTRDITESCTVVTEAENEEQAAENAFEACVYAPQGGDTCTKWVTDDMSADHPYDTGIQEKKDNE